jgi:hypothetical protein
MKLTYLILTFFFIGCSTTQSVNTHLESTFYQYRELVESKKYDSAFDYYHPSFLKYIPKNDLKKEFIKMNTNPNYSYSVKNSKLISYSKIVEKDSIKYTILKYGAETHLKFKSGISKDKIDKIKTYYQKQYGNHYDFSTIDNKIITYKEQELIGINDSSTWKFIMYKDKLKPYMSYWLPDTVLDSLLSFR